MSLKDINNYVRLLQVRLNKRLDKVERTIISMPVTCAQGEISVEIKDNTVRVSAPPHTIIQCDCWVDDVTTMNEQFEMGSEENHAMIIELEALQARLEIVEQRL